MAKKKVAEQVPVIVAVPPSFWENEQGAAAIDKIKAAGHLVFPCKRSGSDAHSQDYIGVAWDNGKGWKTPCAHYSDYQLFTLSALMSLAELGREAFLGMKTHEEKIAKTRHMRIYWQDGTNEVVEPKEAHHIPHLKTKPRLEARFQEDGVRALYMVDFNPYTNEVTGKWKPVYGYWLWNQEEQFLVVIRPFDEEPPKLPSCWLRTI